MAAGSQLVSAAFRWFSRQTCTTRRRVIMAGAIAAVTAPIWLINITVATLGTTVVFPLSPFFLKEKITALASYAAHRPGCFFLGHPETATLVAAAERRHRLPRGLLAALVAVESNGRPHRISRAGAMGPGQLMPGTARALGVSDPFDSAENIDAAARLLAAHIARFGSLRLAVAAYNAGPGAVRGGRVPANGETPAYVAKVMRGYASMRPLRPSARPVPLVASAELPAASAY